MLCKLRLLLFGTGTWHKLFTELSACLCARFTFQGEEELTKVENANRGIHPMIQVYHPPPWSKSMRSANYNACRCLTMTILVGLPHGNRPPGAFTDLHASGPRIAHHKLKTVD